MTTADDLAAARVLVIIPTYQERESLPLIVARVRTAVPTAHVLVADDNSPDGTGKIADELAASDDHLHVLHRPAKNGLGAAYVAGFEWALSNGYDAIVEMDADGSHQPEQLPNLLACPHRRGRGPGIAVGARRQGQQLAEIARGPQPRGQRLCQGRPWHSASRRHWRLSGLPRQGPSIVRPHDGAFAGLLLPSRPRAPQLAARLSRGRSADLVRGARTGRQQDEPRDRARSTVAGHGVGRPRATRPARAPTAARLRLGGLATPSKAEQVETFLQDDLKLRNAATLEQHVPVGARNLDPHRLA